jgi:phosphatidylglycerol---prolipoprotein diacylglyceryl transferase
VIVAEAFKLGINPLAWTILSRIELGPLAVSPHGIGVALGYLLGAQVMVRRARRIGGPPEDDIWNALFWALVGALVGARVGYVLGHLSEVTDGGQDPLGVFKVYEGGISLLGGITGGIVAAVPYVRRRHMGFWPSLDLAVVGLAFGIFIGRFGDLAIGDHLGKPTSFPLGWRCLADAATGPAQPASVYLEAFRQGQPPSLGCFALTLHQTALYDLVSSLILFGALVALGRSARRAGFLALVFGAWYGSMRVVTDFLRVDKRYWGLTGSQILAAVVVLISVYLLARYRGVPPSWTPARGDPTQAESGAAA